MNQIRKAFRNYSLIVIAIFEILSMNVQAQSVGSSLELDGNQVNQLKAERQSNGAWQLETAGKDPCIYTQPLKQAIGSDAKILSFHLITN